MRIAITGGIGEGKSTVLGYLEEAGFSVASADAIARDVFADPAIQAQLTALVGADRPVEPAALRDWLSRHADNRRRLNAIMHPEIARRMEASSATFFEIPLVIETCRYLAFDEVWVVTCGAVEQRRRLMERYQDEVQVEAMIATQISSEVKIVFGDRIFRTNAPPEHVRLMVSAAAVSILVP